MLLIRCYCLSEAWCRGWLLCGRHAAGVYNVSVRELDGIASGYQLGSVALAMVSVTGSGIAAAPVTWQMLRAAEAPADRGAVAVHVGFLLRASVVGAKHGHPAGPANDAGEVAARQGCVVAVGLGDVGLLACPGDGCGVRGR